MVTATRIREQMGSVHSQSCIRQRVSERIRRAPTTIGAPDAASGPYASQPVPRNVFCWGTWFLRLGQEPRMRPSIHLLFSRRQATSCDPASVCRSAVYITWVGGSRRMSVQAKGTALRAFLPLTPSYPRWYDGAIKWTGREYKSRITRLVHGCKAVRTARVLF